MLTCFVRQFYFIKLKRRLKISVIFELMRYQWKWLSFDFLVSYVFKFDVFGQQSIE